MINIYDILKDIVFENPIVFEIGVHKGQDTKKLLDVFKNVNYYGFECDPRNIANIKTNSVYDKITLVEFAVSNKNGVADFYMSNGTPQTHSINNTASSSLHEPTGHLERWKWVTFERPIQVNTCTLDTFCQENNIDHIDFIWADVQGGEYNMILGAQNILKFTRYLYTEYSNVELYKDQKPLNDLLKILPGNWSVVKDFRSDVFLKNIDLYCK